MRRVKYSYTFDHFVFNAHYLLSVYLYIMMNKPRKQNDIIFYVYTMLSPKQHGTFKYKVESLIRDKPQLIYKYFDYS